MFAEAAEVLSRMRGTKLLEAALRRPLNPARSERAREEIRRIKAGEDLVEGPAKGTQSEQGSRLRLVGGELRALKREGRSGIRAAPCAARRSFRAGRAALRRAGPSTGWA